MDKDGVEFSLLSECRFSPNEEMESTNKKTNKHVCSTDWIANALGEGFSKWQASLLPDKPQHAVGAFAPWADVSSTSPPQQAPFASRLCAYVSKRSHQPWRPGGVAQLSSMCLNLPPFQHRRKAAHQEWSLAHRYPLNRVQIPPEGMPIWTGQGSVMKHASNLKDIKKKKALLTCMV